jgi:NAD dependent epimerase/dehydratase family enzyme
VIEEFFVWTCPSSALTETFDEKSPRRSEDFLSQVVEQWEEAANAYPADVRLIKLRIFYPAQG